MARDIKSVLKAGIHSLLSPSPSQPNTSTTIHSPHHHSQTHEQEIHNALAAHNSARRSARGARRPDLKWSKDLEAHAQKWADHLAASGEFRHEGRRGEGENLYTRTSDPYTRKSFRHAVRVWVAERGAYSGQRIGGGEFGALWSLYADRMGKLGLELGVIWPGTTHVGMASAAGWDGRQVVVARYAPGGNVVGMDAFHR
ncbi:Golgi-associated plant pathogenesis-related protein 1 [Lachnellula arida]|uniref:Golgi-associated plant pathogenesis-related protein 1 n=1 Tax=Lachnellula arida TaxID=1316785 RepID=A0A8T9BFF9_9HELO|nr:Golgi-associated plant pathogenesis-related protein 1 [Lachnellula arida]